MMARRLTIDDQHLAYPLEPRILAAPAYADRRNPLIVLKAFRKGDDKSD